MRIHLPQRVCSDTRAALEREWLVTNGLGGFAAGTLAGALTRRYHGLLFAALQPPVRRTLLVAKLDETALLDGYAYRLYTNVWQSGLEEPAGCRLIERFDLVWGVPTWTFRFGGARLIKRIWMEQGRNLTFVQYALEHGSPPVSLSCRLLVNARDYHHLSRGGDALFQVHAAGAEVAVYPPGLPAPCSVRCATVSAAGVRWCLDYAWCRGFRLDCEAARGFDHTEDHFAVGRCEFTLSSGTVATFSIRADASAAVDEAGALARREQHARSCLTRWEKVAGGEARRPAALEQLVLAADQFIVARPTPDETDGHTIIAGYPWFTDWGRDAMISLPGLTLVTGRPEIARQILRTWARYVDRGLIPNRFPDEGDPPVYNTADAALWYLWAIDQYVRATGDVATLAELFPVMRGIVDWYQRGTHHQIHIAADGLVVAGAPGINLTWMDAQIGSRVITPRTGKPVELSALWYDALCNLARLADLVEVSGAEYVHLAERTRAAFARFWNAQRGCCYDVLDGPAGADPRVRPNQIFAVSLTHSPLTRRQQEAVVRTCARKLATWYGLRSLAPDEADYRARYVGGPVERDEAYHQGTAWGWLLGPFVIAQHRLHRDAAAARAGLAPALGQVWAGCIGTLSEIFDAEEPFAANGCFAQAWSVAELLRAWHVTQ